MFKEKDGKIHVPKIGMNKEEIDASIAKFYVMQAKRRRFLGIKETYNCNSYMIQDKIAEQLMLNSKGIK